MREETEVITKGKKGVFMHPVPALGIKVSEYSPVFPEKSVHVPYEIIRITVQPVIKAVPALVRAEFLITAAANNIAAIETFTFHSTNVSVNIQKEGVL